MYELFAAAEGAEEVLLADINPWAVGITIFVLLVLTVIGLTIFGKGREHA